MPTTTTTTTTTTTASGGTTTTTTTTVTSVPAATTRSVPAATTPSYPNSLAEVSVEWLSELLGSTVASFEARPILNGAMGDAAVITPTYAEAGSGVPSLFLKYQKEAEQARGMAMGAAMYEKELLFFRTLGAPGGELSTIVGVPNCLGSWVDPDKPNAESFCLALEDLSREFDALEGTMTWDDAKAMTQICAKMHARYWKDAELAKQAFLVPKDGGDFKPWFSSWVEYFEADKAGSLARWAEHMMKGPTGQDDWPSFDITHKGLGPDPALPEMAEMVETVTGPKAGGIFKEMYKIFSSRPHTLIHGDLRADNLFRSKGKNAAGEHSYKIVDWQAVAFGPAGVDFNQLLASTLENRDDYGRLDELFEPYYATLIAAAPEAASYTLEQIKHDFACTLVLWFVALLPVLSGIFDDIKAMPEARDKRRKTQKRRGVFLQHPLWVLMSTAFANFFAALKGVGAPAIIKAIAEGVSEEGIPPAN